MLTKIDLKNLNNKMLGLGAPVTIDGIGYNKMDYTNMYDFVTKDWERLTDRQIWWVAKTLGKYKNTQLIQYKVELENTIEYYEKISEPMLVKVVGKTRDVVQLTWKFNQNVNNQLKGTLDKTQYRWSKIDNKWVLNVKWDYVPTLIKAFESVKLNCENIKQAVEEHNQPTLFDAPKESLAVLTELRVNRTEEVDTLELFFQYSPELVSILHTIPNAKWDKQKKCWKINIKHARDLYNRLPVSVNKTELKKWGELNWNHEYKLVDYSQYSLPFVPYDFQPEDAKKLLQLKRGLNGNEVGCGKTFEMILVGESIPMSKLVICPASLRLNWAREISMINPNVPIHIQYSDQPFQTVDGWNIIGYPSLEKFQKELEQECFQVIMADEAHFIQAIDNYGKPTSKRAYSVLRLAATAEYVYPITGTPKTNRNKNLYNILRMIDHPLTHGFGSFQRYGKHFCDGFKTPYGWDYSGNSNDSELYTQLSPYMVRHLKKNVLPHLQKQRQSIPVSINLNEYQRIIHEFLTKHNSDAVQLVTLTKAKQAVAIQKAKHSIEFAKNLIESGEKVVIVTGYTEVVDKVCKAFGTKCLKLVGGMSDKEKQTAIDSFQYGDTPVIVINIIAGGVGVTLTAASNMIINDMSFVPGENEQAEGRIWRSGQTKTAMIYYMVALNCPMDEFLVDLIVNKSYTINQAIDGGLGTEYDLKTNLFKHLRRYTL